MLFYRNINLANSMPEIPETTHTTANGFEINSPREELTSQELREMVEQYGLAGETPEARVDNLRAMPNEAVALFLADVNKRLQGSDETLVSRHTIKVGEKSTVAPEYRYDLFTSLMDKVRSAGDVNPARVGDALGLGIVILHPFEDGNGRTARMMALLFREEYDTEDYSQSFDILKQSRDELRARGENIVNSFIPYFPEGADQSQPEVVEQYFEALLTQDEGRLYNGPGGQAPLTKS